MSSVPKDSSQAATEELICPECGYDLRGIVSERCPECGAAIDREALAASGVPWTRRGELGAWRAYFRTVLTVVRRPGRVAGEIVRPVSWGDALRFRRRTALVATVAPAVLLVGYGVAELEWLALANAFASRSPQGGPLPPMARVGWVMELLGVPIACAALYLYFFAASGVAGWFFRPPGLSDVRKDRAVAIAQYACAPLALTPVSVLVGGVAWWCYGSIKPHRLDDVAAWQIIGLTASLAAGGVIALQVIATFLAPLRLLSRSTHCSAARLFAMAVVLPVAWTLLAAVIAVGIPAAYVFICLVLLSFMG